MPHTDIMTPTAVPRLTAAPGPAGTPPAVFRPSAVIRPAAARSRRRLANDPVNWWLISLAIVYLAWSYYLLASSIWIRMVMLVLFTWRMKPDIIIPYVLMSLQLRLAVSETMTDEVRMGSDITQGLTGFESYAFAIPPLLFSVRAAVAFFSTRTDRRHFPSLIYLLWALGFVIVIIGAFVNFRSGRGWTGALRGYSLVGAVFYGLMMPRLKPAELDRLANASMVVTVAVFMATLTGLFGSRLMFVLGPLAATWGVLGVLSISVKTIPAVPALALTGLVCLFRSTFMAFGGWMWGMIAGIVLWSRPRAGVRDSARPRQFVAATVLFTIFLFVVGIQRQVSDKSGHDGTLLGRIEHKLYADRGPIWKGCLQIIMEEPSILPTPERGFTIKWFGSEDFWENGPHNLFLDLMNQLGWIAGPIAVIVCLYTVAACSRVLSRDDCSGALVLASCAICAIVVGGLTLPFVIQERQGEFVWLVAGLTIGSSGVNVDEARRMMQQRA